MKICVIGTGGVGGYYGGRIAEAGYDVTFMARGEHLRAIKENGLTVKSINGDFNIHPAKATDNPTEKFDLVLIAVKVWHLHSLKHMLNTISHDDTIFLPLENGIESVDILHKMVNPQQVLGGLCRLFSWIEAPGVIKHGSYDPSITFGETDNTQSDRVKEIAHILERSHIKVKIATDIDYEVWLKFLAIASASSIGALTRSPYGVYRSIPETRQLLIDLISEMVEVGIAKGVNITKKLVQKTMDFIDAMPKDATTSLQRDMMQGKPSEIDGQLGAIIRLADSLNVKVYHAKCIYAALLPQEKMARNEI